MLLTRCPSCNTAFRITAELLKQASGQVRCGRCNHVFAAFAHLEEAQAEPDAHGIGSYTPPPEAEPSAPAEETEPAPTLADELAETSEYEALALEPASDPLAAPADDEPAAVTADELVEIFDGDPLKEGQSGGETMATENQALLATIDPDQPLDLELPPDEWQAFFEAEGLVTAVDEPAPVAADSPAPEAEPVEEEAFIDLTPVAEDMETPELTDVEAPEPFAAAEVDTETAEAEATEESDVPQAAQPADAAWATDTDGHVIDLEQARAEAEPPAAADEEPWAVQETGSAAPPARRWWGIGAGVAAAALMLQLTHHYRNVLASQAIVGPVVRAVYGGVGAELAPQWDVQQYEIDDWIATAGPARDGQSSLTITATLLNRGPRDQPHPYVRLELKDRWDESVGSRVFKPGEYLPEPPGPGELMASGARVPALLAVVDPGEDAYGFELDVCVPSGADQLRCANENVF